MHCFSYGRILNIILSQRYNYFKPILTGEHDRAHHATAEEWSRAQDISEGLDWVRYDYTILLLTPPCVSQHGNCHMWPKVPMVVVKRLRIGIRLWPFQQVGIPVHKDPSKIHQVVRTTTATLYPKPQTPNPSLLVRSQRTHRFVTLTLILTQTQKDPKLVSSQRITYFCEFLGLSKKIPRMVA